jgi:hypothetical protein
LKFLSQDNVILAGDFNFGSQLCKCFCYHVSSFFLQCISGVLNAENKLIEQSPLIDCWRDLHPGDDGFTMPQYLSYPGSSHAITFNTINISLKRVSYLD